MVLVGFFFAFTLFFVPETKGKSIQEISSHFRKEGENGTSDDEDNDWADSSAARNSVLLFFMLLASVEPVQVMIRSVTYK